MMLNRSDGESLDLMVFQVHQLMPYSVILKRTLRHICVISFFDGTPMTSLYRRQVCFWELLLVLLTFHNTSIHLSSSQLSCQSLQHSSGSCSPVLTSLFQLCRLFYNSSLDQSGVTYFFTCNSLLHPCGIQPALLLQSSPYCFSCADLS